MKIATKSAKENGKRFIQKCSESRLWEGYGWNDDGVDLTVTIEGRNHTLLFKWGQLKQAHAILNEILTFHMKQ